MLNKLLTKFTTLKVYAQRSLLYYQLLNSAMIILIFAGQRGFPLYLQIGLLIVSAGIILTIGYFDTKLKILEREQAHFNKENDYVQMMKRSVPEILKRLEKIERKVK